MDGPQLYYLNKPLLGKHLALMDWCIQTYTKHVKLLVTISVFLDSKKNYHLLYFAKIKEKGYLRFLDIW